MLFGFDDKGDLIPEVLFALPTSEINRIFITQFNENVDDELKIPPRYANSNSIKEIFRRYIDDTLAIHPLKFSPCKSFCISSNLVINAYKNGQNLKYLAKFPQMKIAKFIAFFGRDELRFNANELFANFIQSKLIKMHGSEHILSDEKMIYLSYNDHKIGILPSFSSFDISDKATFENEVKKAFDFSEGLDMVYIAFPRQENLKKYINIKNVAFHSEKLVKIVPYSITNKILRRKKCQ